MKKIFILALLFSLPAQADFGEIDILVKESIENHFRDYGRSVDLGRMEYFGGPKMDGQVMVLRSSVWAEHGFGGGMGRTDWGWHDCTTRIQVDGPGKYKDLGSDCFYETE